MRSNVRLSLSGTRGENAVASVVHSLLCDSYRCSRVPIRPKGMPTAAHERLTSNCALPRATADCCSSAALLKRPLRQTQIKPLDKRSSQSDGH